MNDENVDQEPNDNDRGCWSVPALTIAGVIGMIVMAVLK
jgi:hypothetical protein